MPGSFEAKLHAYRRTQDGAVISFVVHPDEIQSVSDLSMAPFGTRLMIGWAQIGDDEKEVETPATTPGGYTIAAQERPEDCVVTVAPRERKPFSSLPLSQQAALRCSDERFQDYMQHYFWNTLTDNNEEYTTQLVRDYCRVGSRSELNTDQDAAAQWRKLEANYQSWLTDQQYAGSQR